MIRQQAHKALLVIATPIINAQKFAASKITKNWNTIGVCTDKLVPKSLNLQFTIAPGLMTTKERAHSKENNHKSQERDSVLAFTARRKLPPLWRSAARVFSLSVFELKNVLVQTADFKLPGINYYIICNIYMKMENQSIA